MEKITQSSNRDVRLVYFNYIRSASLSPTELNDFSQVICYRNVGIDEITSLILYCIDNGNQTILNVIKANVKSFGYIMQEIRKYRNNK